MFQRKECQTACKPGSVPPPLELSWSWSWGGDGHSSGTPVAERLVRPTRAAARRSARHSREGMPAAPTWSCSRWGFPCRRRCRRRGALLPHRFTLAGRPVFRGGPAVYFLWHFPWGRPRRALPGTVPPWSPDFPPSTQRQRAAIRPSGATNLGVRDAPVKAGRRPHTNGRMGFYGLYHLSCVSTDGHCAARARFYNRRKLSREGREEGTPCRWYLERTAIVTRSATTGLSCRRAWNSMPTSLRSASTRTTTSMPSTAASTRCACSTAAATSCARGARACSCVRTGSTWRLTTRSG